MTAPLLTRACSSLVRVSGLAESSGKKKAVSSRKTLNCAPSVLTSGFLMQTFRSSVEFLSDYFYASRRRRLLAEHDISVACRSLSPWAFGRRDAGAEFGFP